ncbi:hypothetical protein PMAYCL1PPCAC_14180, partial [Pristionchus mayeri]
MADPGSVEPLFVSLRTTAALTGNNNDAFSQVLHQLNAVLNARAAGGSSSSEMYRAAVGELMETIARNERGMYGDARNIAFLNFAKSFAALSDSSGNSMFDPLSLHCATASDASPSSAPPRLLPISRNVYQMLHDEREYEQLADFSLSASPDDDHGRRTGQLSPHYQSSSPMYDLDAKSDFGSEREPDAPRTVMPHDSMISALFAPAAGDKVASSKPPAAKKQRMSAPKEKADPPEPDVCPHCEFQSNCAAHITKHVRINHPTHWLDFAMVGCQSCDYRCRNSHTLRKHVKAVHGEAWKQWNSQCRLNFPSDAECPFCGVQAEDIQSLSKHVIKQHIEDLSKEDPYIGCDACEEKFN